MHVLLLSFVGFGIRRIYSCISMETHAAHIIFFPVKHGQQLAKVINNDEMPKINHGVLLTHPSPPALD